MTLLLLGDASVYGISRGPSHLVACGKSLVRVSVSVFPLLYIYIWVGKTGRITGEPFRGQSSHVLGIALRLIINKQSWHVIAIVCYS